MQTTCCKQCCKLARASSESPVPWPSVGELRDQRQHSRLPEERTHAGCAPQHRALSRPCREGGPPRHDPLPAGKRCSGQVANMVVCEVTVVTVVTTSIKSRFRHGSRRSSIPGFSFSCTRCTSCSFTSSRTSRMANAKTNDGCRRLCTSVFCVLSRLTGVATHPTEPARG